MGAFAMRAPDFATLKSAYPFLAVSSTTEGGEVALTVGRGATWRSPPRRRRQTRRRSRTPSIRSAPTRRSVETIVALDARSARYAYDQLSGAIYPFGPRHVRGTGDGGA